jgi:hypothetical protein
MDDDRQVLDLLKRGQSVFAIALDPVVEELRGEVTAFPMERVNPEDVIADPAPMTATGDVTPLTAAT